LADNNNQCVCLLKSLLNFALNVIAWTQFLRIDPNIVTFGLKSGNYLFDLSFIFVTMTYKNPHIFLLLWCPSKDDTVSASLLLNGLARRLITETLTQKRLGVKE
jgi:hypothetical protein